MKHSAPAPKKTTSNALGLINREDKVQVAISGLKTGSVYHYRVVAENSEGTTDGEDETFSHPSRPPRYSTSPPRLSAPNWSSSKPNSTPTGSRSTSYTIQYGENTAFPGGTFHGTLPIGNEFEEVVTTFSGLKPNTTYHYQLRSPQRER